MIVACSVCGTRNRVIPSRAVGRQPACGRCGAWLEVNLPPITSSGTPLEVTDQTFDGVLKAAADLPLLLDCWATWCPPCQMLAPTIDALAAEAGGRWVVGKLDTDANPSTAARFDIQSLPTLLLFRQGHLVDRLVGLQPKQAIEARLLGA